MSTDSRWRAETRSVPVPNARIRGWTVFFLRAGLGMILLSSGVMRYLGTNATGRFGFGMGGVTPMTVVGDIGRLVPYFEIAFGVALVLGFFTTYAAAGALALEILLPGYQTLVTVVSQAVMMGAGGMPSLEMFFPSMRASMVLLGAAVLWLSPSATNPYSLDALISRGDDDSDDEIPPSVVDDEFARPIREPASTRLVGRPMPPEETLVTPIDDEHLMPPA